MARLIDELRAGGRLMAPHFVPPTHQGEWKRMALRLHEMLSSKDLPVMLIDNVADYYYQSEQEYWDLRYDFPNLAPPYPAFWVEHRLPKKIHSKECGDTDMSFIRDGRVGGLVVALERGDWDGVDIPDATKWILWCELYIDYGRDERVIATGPHGSMFLCVDENGGALKAPWMQTLAGPSHAEIMKDYITWLYPSFLAISFLHCKNVTVEENRVPKPLAKKWHEKHGGWPTPYKTLVIEPLKQVLKREGKQGEVGLAKAMHICRGHFKDYREGRGLFGKYHQLVWQPSIVRGTKGKQAPPREVEVKL